MLSELVIDLFVLFIGLTLLGVLNYRSAKKQGTDLFLSAYSGRNGKKDSAWAE